MTITNGYCTLAELKQGDRLNITSTSYDTALEGVIESVSRGIDNMCSRFFYTESSTVTRYFTAKDEERLLIGTWAAVASVSVAYSTDLSYTSWTEDTDYFLYPYDADSDDKPFTMIEVAQASGKQFVPGIRKGVKLTGQRGYPSVPEPVKEACLLWAMRAYKRYSTPLGVSSMTALGQMSMKVPPPDPDVLEYLSPYMDRQFG